MVSQASTRGEGEQQRLPKLSLSENVAPETGMLLCSCLCTPWSAKPRLAEKVSSSDFPSSHCQRMLHQRQDCCSAAVFAPHGQPSLDPRRKGEQQRLPKLSLSENVAPETTVALQLFVHSMVSQASTRGEGEQQRLPKLSLSENVAPETGLLLCSCFCTPWSAKLRFAEKVSSSDFPNSHCQRMLHQRQD